MPRRPGNVGDHAQAVQLRPGRRNTPKDALSVESLSPAKRRIAEALAALLVAHYRRQHGWAKREQFPVA
jgi:hypothetical protein